MNVLNNTSAIRTCTSCQMCGAVCPTSAINILLDDEGFYRPFINMDVCVDCGGCVDVCYKYDKELISTTKETLQHVHHYAASAVDDSIVESTTSGGIACLLARELVSQGYKVIGVVYDTTTDRAISQVGSDDKECLQFRGSKYIQTYSIDAFRTLVRNCRWQKFAVFGLPCHIYAVSKFLTKIGVRDKCLLVDLSCHGCPTMYLWKKVVIKLHQEVGCEKFETVEFRSKYRGWGDYVLKVSANNGKTYHSSPSNNEFYDLFFSNHLLNNSCFDCKLRSTLGYTDIRLGDYWGKEYRKNVRGISGVTLVSKLAIDVFDAITPYLSCRNRDINTYLHYQSWNHAYYVNQELRNDLMDILKDKNKTINDAMKQLQRNYSLSLYLKKIIKQLLYYFPVRVAALFRR